MKNEELESIRKQIQVVGEEKEELAIKTQDLHDQNRSLRAEITELQDTVQQITAVNSIAW